MAAAALSSAPHSDSQYAEEEHASNSAEHHKQDGVAPSQSELIEALRHQLDFYFSADNLVNDAFLVSNMNTNRHVPVDVIINFKRVQQLTTDKQTLLEASRLCKNCEPDATEQYLKATPQIQRTKLILRDLPCTVAVEAVRDALESESSPAAGHIVSVKPDMNDTWYVVLDSEEATTATAEWCVFEQPQVEGYVLRARVKSETVLRGFFAATGNAPNSSSPMMVPGTDMDGLQPQASMYTFAPNQPDFQGPYSTPYGISSGYDLNGAPDDMQVAEFDQCPSTFDGYYPQAQYQAIGSKVSGGNRKGSGAGFAMYVPRKPRKSTKGTDVPSTSHINGGYTVEGQYASSPTRKPKKKFSAKSQFAAVANSSSQAPQLDAQTFPTLSRTANMSPADQQAVPEQFQNLKLNAGGNVDDNFSYTNGSVYQDDGNDGAFADKQRSSADETPALDFTKPDSIFGKPEQQKLKGEISPNSNHSTPLGSSTSKLNFLAALSALTPEQQAERARVHEESRRAKLRAQQQERERMHGEQEPQAETQTPQEESRQIRRDYKKSPRQQYVPRSKKYRDAKSFDAVDSKHDEFKAEDAPAITASPKQSWADLAKKAVVSPNTNGVSSADKSSPSASNEGANVSRGDIAEYQRMVNERAQKENTHRRSLDNADRAFDWRSTE